jgi:hypothetical protein
MCGQLIHFISDIEVRSDYETTLSIRSEMNILVPKSEQIRSDRIRIGFPHLSGTPIDCAAAFQSMEFLSNLQTALTGMANSMPRPDQLGDSIP